MQALTSLRGAANCLDIFSDYFQGGVPSHTTIQNWILQYGIYQLSQIPEHRDDWIYIVDSTIEFGEKKCLVILGVTLETFNENKCTITHEDVEVLKIVIGSKSNGTTVNAALEEAAELTGAPKAIISDQGSDITKGIALFQESGEGSQYIYDITHKCGVLLKHYLEYDGRWEEFIRQCATTKRKSLNTKFGFLVPPKPSDKSRWLKVDSHIEWARKLLEYSDHGLQEEQTEHYSICEEALEHIKSINLNPVDFEELKNMRDVQFKAKKDFMQMLRSRLKISGRSKAVSQITYYASDANRKFLKYFSWIEGYRADIEEWDEALWLLKSAKVEVKQAGLCNGTYRWYSDKCKHIEFKSIWTRELQRDMEEYLKVQGAVIPERTVWPGTSDIIESIFGKYKNFSARTPMKGISKMILTIPVFTSKITVDSVRKALESVKVSEMRKWIGSNLGQSLFSKRRNFLLTAS